MIGRASSLPWICVTDDRGLGVVFDRADGASGVPVVGEVGIDGMSSGCTRALVLAVVRVS